MESPNRILTDYEGGTSTVAERNVVFFFVFIGVLVLTYGVLYIVDFLPEAPRSGIPPTVIAIPKQERALEATPTPTPTVITEGTHNETGDTDTEPIDSTSKYPIRITFDTLGRSVDVLNPESRSVSALDTALLSGVVRHPDSADFEKTGTIFLFGHSSYLPNVLNKNFQAFNGIQKLTWGDTIRLYSIDREYVYRVDRVYEASALNAEIKIETGKPKLTLVTCDSFGSKSDRFIVEATLIESSTLATVEEENA